MRSKQRNMAVGMFLAVTSVGLLAVFASASSSSLPVRAAVYATTSEPHPEDDFFLGPAPDRFEPKVSVDEAVAAAARQEDLSRASAIQPTLATLTLPHFQPVDPETDKPIGPPFIVDVPVWVITVDGVCVASSGSRFVLDPRETAAMPSPDPCFYHQAKIIIDATTGNMILEATFVGSP